MGCRPGLAIVAVATAACEGEDREAGEPGEAGEPAEAAAKKDRMLEVILLLLCHSHRTCVKFVDIYGTT